MKHKKHRLTDDDSVDSEDSDEGSDKSSSSDSDSDSVEYERRHKKKKRYDSSSQSKSDSDSSDHRKRSKKRKHKKKKKKHSKKKRHVESAEELSDSNVSYEHEHKRKSKHKHKHGSSKKSNSSTRTQYESDHNGYNVHSTVKETHTTIEDYKQPHGTYYQKPYHNHDEDKREEEVQRFYRGSSKDRYSQVRREHYQDHREHNSSRQRYEVPHEVDYRKPYHSSRGGGYEHKEYSRGDGHHRQGEVPKRHDYDDGRKYQERRGGYHSERYHGREYPENRERYRDNPYPDRGREPRREKYERGPPPPAAHYREPSRSRSRSPRHRQERPDRYHRTDDRRRPDDKRYEHRPEKPADRRPDVRTDDRRRDRPDNDKPPYKKRSRFAADEGKEYEWGKTEVKKEGSPSAADKEKPNFGLSGKLTADANTVNGVVIKYTEPDDAKQPKRRWRFYPFKGDKSLPILFIHRQSCFILGRDKKVVDIHLEHPSVSKQHAALQYRATPFERADGTEGRRVRPYIIDLESANGTFVNNKKIEARRYVELLERDVVKFGFSQREYVLLHENSKDDAQDDDNREQPAEIGAAVTTAQQIKLEKHYKEAAVADGD